VNLTLVLATLRQRFTSPPRVILLLVLGWFPLLQVFFAPALGLGPVGDCYWFALVLAAGMIGQDLSAGTLQLLLARPVTRTSYVLSRWAGVALGATGVALVQIGIASLLLSARGMPPDARALLVVAGNTVLVACGAAAVMALLSSLVPALGDIFLLAALFTTTIPLIGVGQVRGWPALLRAAEEVQRTLYPKLDLAPLVHGAAPSGFEVVSYLSTVTLCLAVAIVVLNRRELSYVSTAG
jgi:hypothetical protein